MKITNTKYIPTYKINNQQQNPPAFNGEFVVIKEGTAQIDVIMLKLATHFAEKIASLAHDFKSLIVDKSMNAKAKEWAEILNKKHANEGFFIEFLEETLN